MKTGKIHLALDEYCNTEEPGYAIMISGPWGSGKTYFIDQFFDGKEQKPIKVSLYGASSAEEIRDNLFSAITSIDEFSESAIQKTGNFIASITSLVSDEDTGSTAGAIAGTLASTLKSRVLSNLNRDTILIFDDLERSNLKASKVLAIINTFVEHQGLKTIIIGDESRIASSCYKDQKEKTVLHTYTIDRTPEEIARIVISSYENIPKFIQNESELELTRTIELLEITNLRTLLFAVKGYERIHQLLQTKNHPDKADTKLTQLIFPCVAFALGFKEMRMQPSDLEKFIESSTVIGVEYHLIQKNKKKGEDIELTDEQLFYENVYSKKSNSFQFRSVFDLICNGFLDYESLASDISVFTPKSLSSKEKLISWYTFPDNESFKQCFIEILDSLKNNTLTFASAHELFSLCSACHHIVRNDGFDMPLDELEKIINQAVLYSIENNTYGHSEIRHTEQGNLFLEDLYKKIAEKTATEKKLSDKKSLQNSIINILTATNLAATQADHDNLSRNSSTTVIDESFYEILQGALKRAAPPTIDDFDAFLKNRYSSSNIFEYLWQEITTLEKLSMWLQNYYDSLPKSYRKYHLSYVQRTLTHILEKDRFEHLHQKPSS